MSVLLLIIVRNQRAIVCHIKNIVDAIAELGGVNVWLAMGGPSPKTVATFALGCEYIQYATRIAADLRLSDVKLSKVTPKSKIAFLGCLSRTCTDATVSVSMTSRHTLSHRVTSASEARAAMSLTQDTTEDDSEDDEATESDDERVASAFGHTSTSKSTPVVPRRRSSKNASNTVQTDAGAEQLRCVFPSS
jgi:hypothetical protein